MEIRELAKYVPLNATQSYWNVGDPGSRFYQDFEENPAKALGKLAVRVIYDLTIPLIAIGALASQQADKRKDFQDIQYQAMKTVEAPQGGLEIKIKG